METNIYQVGAPATELKRLETFEWSNQVSKSIIEAVCENIPFARILDAGCGPGTQMAEICNSLKKLYFGFDNGKTEDGELISEVLKENLFEKNIPGVITYGSVLDDIDTLDINFQNNQNQPDIIHMRFVLMHMPKVMWKQVIKNMVNAALDKVVLIEYDWISVKSSSHPDLIEGCIKTFEKFANLVNLDLYAGGKVKNNVDELGYSANYNIYSRAEGKFADELLSKIPTAIQICKKINETELADELIKKMNLIRAYSDELTLVPAEAHAVVIDIQN